MLVRTMIVGQRKFCFVTCLAYSIIVMLASAPPSCFARTWQGRTDYMAL